MTIAIMIFITKVWLGLCKLTTYQHLNTLRSFGPTQRRPNLVTSPLFHLNISVQGSVTYLYFLSCSGPQVEMQDVVDLQCTADQFDCSVTTFSYINIDFAAVVNDYEWNLTKMAEWNLTKMAVKCSKTINTLTTVVCL